MPYRLNWNKDFLIFEYYGAVTSQDIRESNQAAYGDERFDDLRWELVFFDEAESVTFKNSDIRLIAYMDEAASKSNPYITVAFVGGNAILTEVEEAYSSAQTGANWPVLHFDNREEAYEYISQKS